MNYTFDTHLADCYGTGKIHAEVTPTMQALGDQPWVVRLRGVAGVLLLSCTVEDSSALGAACATIRIETVEVAQPLTRWQELKIGAFWYLLAGLIAALLWIIRKPLLKLIKL